MGLEKRHIIEEASSEYLYQPDILLQLDFSRSPARFSPKISAAQPGEEWMVVRPLQRADYDKGFLQLLSQLTSTGNVTRKQFDERFTQMKSSGGYYVTVIEDKRIAKIIGAATLTVEQKFIHNCSVRGRLEDVVVNDTYRGKQLGKLIVVTVSLLAQALGCYKMSLDCKDHLVKFYTTLGYKLEPGNSNAMNMRIVVTVSLLAQALGCYKMSLDCKDHLVKFYTTLGYKLEPGNSNAMNMRFEEPS